MIQQQINILEKCCILEKSRKNLVKFGENSSKILATFAKFWKKTAKIQQFLTKILRLVSGFRSGAKECIVQISARAFQRVFTCKIWLRYSRERAYLILINFSFLQLFNFDRALASWVACAAPVTLLHFVGFTSQADLSAGFQIVHLNFRNFVNVSQQQKTTSSFFWKKTARFRRGHRSRQRTSQHSFRFSGLQSSLQRSQPKFAKCQ